MATRPKATIDDSHLTDDPEAPNELRKATEASVGEQLIDHNDARKLLGGPPGKVRTQADGRGDEYSKRTALDCSGAIDKTRQEFKDDTDTLKILQRFGVEPMRRGTFGTEVDYSIDLQAAMTAIEDVERAHSRLPKHLRDKYQTPQQLLDAAQRGELTTLDQEKPKEAAPNVTPAPATPTPGA